MKKSLQSRIRSGLFPEMPQSFTNKLQHTLITAKETEIERTEPDAAVSTDIQEPRRRRFSVGRILTGVATAALAVACIAIVAVVGISKLKERISAKPPAAGTPEAVGRWAMTELIWDDGRHASAEEAGVESTLTFQDGTLICTWDVNGSTSRTEYGYTVEGNSILLYADLIRVNDPEITYDPETDTLHLFTSDDGRTCVYTRMPDLVGKWTLTRIGEISPEKFAVQYGEEMEFFADGTVKVIQKFFFDITEETYAYTVYGKSIQISTEGNTAPAFLLLPEQLVYDRETDTLRCSAYEPDTGRQDELIFSRTPNAIIYHSLVGKWTLTGIELYGSTGSPETSGLEMYLEFSDKDSVTVTRVKETGTERQTYRWRFISGNEIEFTNKDYVTSSVPYTFLYDAAADTLRWDPDGFGLKGVLIFSRTPDAVIPETERKEITELRKQYPEYFGLDTSKGLKVYVWQMVENDFSCAMISGTDERSELEIGIQCKGTTIEQMRLIYSTYDAVKNDIDVEVVPFHNPISSYWYEIDKDYTDHVTWLTIGVSDAWIDDAEIYDVDGDGQLETCELWQGPTPGRYTPVLTITRNGTVICQNTFNMAPWLWFAWKDGALTIKWKSQDSGRETYYRITIENGAIVLTDEDTGETVPYWGAADSTWNMAVAEQSPAETLAGLWCAMNAEEGADGLMKIVFYREGDAHLASFYESGILYDGYTYTVEKQRKTERWDTDDAYAYTFTNQNGHVRKLILCGKDVLDFDMTEWKDDTEEHKYCTYLKLTPIEADELPYQQQAYIGAGEGYISYLDLVDLTGDGEPERVSFDGYTPDDWAEQKEGEPTLTVQLGREVFKLNEKLVSGSIIYIDLDPTNEWVNVLFSTETQDGKEKTYELHLEKEEPAMGQRIDCFKLVCGHVIDGYCFLADSPEQELTIAVPTDLFGAKFGYREVRGEALKPVDDRLYASGVIEAVTFGPGREKNIEDGTLLHLVRALPCEIDGVLGTLEPDVDIYLREWNESLTEIVFMTEDGRWITVRPDAGLLLDGVSLYEYFDNAPQG